ALWFGIVTATLQVCVGAGAPAHIDVARATPAPAARVAPVVATAPAAPAVEHAAGAARAARAAHPVVATARTGAPRWSVALPAWHDALVALWLAGVAAALVALFRARWRLEVAVAAMPPLDGHEADREAEALALAANVRPPRLRASEGLASPLAAFGDTICLPRWSLAAPRAARAAMLAHEVAHIARRDTLWRALDLVAQSLLAHHPLALLARRRLAALAELSCDAWAARATGEARALAESLVQCVEHAGRMRAPLLAAAMATSRSPLVERVHSLIEERHMGPLNLRTHSRALVLTALVAGAFVLPAIGLAGIAAAAGSSHTSIIDTGDGERMTMDVDLADGSELEAKSRGRFTFTPAEDDVATLERGASLEIEQKRNGTKRSIEFTAGANGVEREYSVDGAKRPLDAEGRRWLAEVIPVLLRTSGLFAEERVERILGQGGPGAVLDEVARIDSDFVRRTYLQALLERAKLDASQTGRTFDLVDGIGSDFERRTVLQTLVETQPLGDAQQVRLLNTTAKIGSDFEQRTVLEALAPKLSTAAEVRRAYGATLATIDSDFERRTALKALTDNRDLDPATIESALAAAADIGSDFEKRESLVALAPHVAKHIGLAKGYAAAAASIGSDFERREALLALVETDALDPAGYAAVLEAAATIGSDFERREVLVGVAAKMPADADLIARYRRIARDLGDFERGQAERALDRFEA
ncbi:MAG TPA: M56 family metallopeptidase, partial [Xanthomonadales bacterium]|nr:M56 family metallopeptidase [Xanthomonadales bacterium]